MAWVNWSRRTAPVSVFNGKVGIEFNASRVRAVTGSAVRHSSLALDKGHADLPMAIGMDQRCLRIGRAAVGLTRLLPHALCETFLPHLGQPREWKAGRHRLDAATAIGHVFATLGSMLGSQMSVFAALPTYLTRPQVTQLTVIASKHGFPIKGTVSTALALAVERAGALLSPPLTEIERRVEGIVPLYRLGKTSLPADAVVIDADEHALTATAVRIEPGKVHALHTATLPGSGVKKWKERLVDALSDRCIQVCRRDPRDSADAEQSLFEQIEQSLDQIQAGDHVTLTLRTGHWYQDLHLQMEDFEAICAGLIRSTVADVRELLETQLDAPPRAVWMTHEAGRLPGLAQSLHQNVAEQTSVGVLRPEAVAIAVANLAERWPGGSLEHFDSAIPLAAPPAPKKVPAAIRTRG